MPLETPSPNEAKQCIPFITPSPMALTETNVDSKAPRKVKIIWLHQEIKDTCAGFYTKLNVWGSLGLNFDYDGGPIIENGGPIFLYKRRILGGY